MKNRSLPDKKAGGSTKLPEHIAFIMDGNGRWAKKRGLPRTAGHSAGAKTFKEIAEGCFELGIKAVTVYAFSTENWKRPKEEVSAIMDLLHRYMNSRIADRDYNYRVCFIGDRTVFSEEVLEKMSLLESINSESDNILYIALNYGGRAEICHAVNSLIQEGKTAITEEDISSRVYTAQSSDPDLIVRTGGDIRVSNFLMWQSAYSEFCFVETLWPDLTMEEVKDIVSSYGNVERRFGGLVK